jgi:hypothetical protein
MGIGSKERLSADNKALDTLATEPAAIEALAKLTSGRDAARVKLDQVS